MTHEVLYRRWRPRRFAEVVGQEPVTTTLRNAVAAGSPAHAYLFTGPRGTGKTSTGRILATAVNCRAPEGGEPCGECDPCRAFDAGRALDLIELDAASNRGIDEIRDLREGAGYAPAAATYKLYLIDEVHMLTDAAFNALLKTLEEPPPHVIFVLATTEPHRVPATISSRCQRFDFRRIGTAETIAELRRVAGGEGIAVTDEGLELLARHATGSLRDAVSLLDQLSSYRDGELDAAAVREGLGLVADSRATELARAAARRDLAAGLAALSAARDDGLEIRAFLRESVATLRALLLLMAGAPGQGSGAGSLGLAQSEAADLEALAAEVGVADVVAALRALGQVDFAGDAYDPLPAEIAFAELVVAPAAAQPGAAAQAAAAALPGPPTAPAAATPAAATPAAPRPRRPRPAGAPAQASAPRAAPQRTSAQAAARSEAPAPRRDAERRPPADAASRPPALPDEGEIPAELAQARSKWPLIQESARRRHSKAGALLNSGCYIKAFPGDRLEIGFRFPTHVDLVTNAEGGAVMQAIREAVADALGRPVEVVPVLWEELAQAKRQAAPPPPSAGGHLIEEALEQGATRAEG